MEHIEHIEQLKKFWAKQAQQIPWEKQWDQVLDWQEPFAKWFVGGTLNASYACLDAHIDGPNKDKVAFYWEDEDGNTQQYTFLQLYKAVNKFASALRNIGVKQGDRVILFLPMIPQAVMAMLACARLGAIHSVVFSAFGASALADRITDAQAHFVITADFTKRRGKLIPLKTVVDQALTELTQNTQDQSPKQSQTEQKKSNNSSLIKKVVVIQRFEQESPFDPTQDCYYHEIIKTADDYIAPQMVDATHPLFILYTSGTTGKPKGIVHSTGGYLVYINSVFNTAFAPNKDSIYWCTADIGWITGHSFITYAPLIASTTSLLYEGSPDYPDIGIWWKLIETYKISIFYTSPTALRMFMRHGTEAIKKHNLDSLQILGSVGETINPDVWRWYHEHIGHNRCPIIDTWWQTETGGFMISPTAKNLIPLKPGSATRPLPGIYAQVVDEQANPVAPNTKGYLIITQPWPGMLMGVYNNPERYKQVYWSKFPGNYYTGDYAKIDEDGYFWLLGRADEVLNVAGHLLGTAEIESAALAYSSVAEAATIGIPDEIKGQAVVLFVTLKKDIAKDDITKKEIIQSIRTHIGPIATPKEIYFVDSLPKTRSGKIMRRILQAIAQGKNIGDISTLENESSVELARNELEKKSPDR